MPAAQSISVHKLSEAARESVAKVVAQHKAKLPIPDYRFGFYPPHWWLGIIIRNPDLDKITFGEANKLATDLTKSIGGIAAAGIRPGHPGAVLDNGHLTIGFAPPEIFFEP